MTRLTDALAALVTGALVLALAALPTMGSAMRALDGVR